jgi:hypothetical protein
MSRFKNPLKITVDDIEEEGDPTDVLEVWFAGCHSGMFFFLPIFPRCIEEAAVRGL